MTVLILIFSKSYLSCQHVKTIHNGIKHSYQFIGIEIWTDLCKTNHVTKEASNIRQFFSNKSFSLSLWIEYGDCTYIH